MDVVTLALAKKKANAYTDTKIGELAEGLHYIGSVATVEDLPASGNEAGDCYNVTDGSGMYAWNGTSWGSASKEGPQGPTGPQGPAGENGLFIVTGTATSTSAFTVNKTKSEIRAALTENKLPVLKMILFGGNESVELPLHQYKETLATLIFDTTANGNNVTYQLGLNADESTYSGDISTKNLSVVSVGSTGTTINKVKYITIDTNEYQLATDVINNVTSTDTDVPLSANMGKALQDQISNLKNIGRFLAILDCSAGSTTSEPTVSPYNYKVGDYYRVGVAGSYEPNPAKSTYTTGASDNFVSGSQSFGIGDVIYCSNIAGTTSTWVKQGSSGGGTVQDVQINGTSILSSGIANIPIASNSTLGVVKAAVNNGTYIESGSGIMTINKSDDAKLVAKTNNYCPVVPSNLNKAVMEGLGNNSLTWSDAYKSSARNTIGAVAIEEYDSTATPVDNILYYVTE